MSGSTARDRTLHGPHGDLPVRVYTPYRANGIGLVWVHGGGFAYGDLDMPEADHTSSWLAHAGVTVVSVDYHLAPAWGAGEEPRTRRSAHFPVASMEVAATFHAVHDLVPAVTADAWFLGGASAGGNLAVSAALRLRDVGDLLPCGIVLAYPVLHAELPTPSAELQTAAASQWQTDPSPAERVREMHRNYLGPNAAPTTPYAFPGGSDLTGLPPVLIVNSDADPLRASGQAFAAELVASGGDVHQVREPDTEHGYLNRPGDTAAERTLARFLGWLTTTAASQRTTTMTTALR